MSQDSLKKHWERKRQSGTPGDRTLRPEEVTAFASELQAAGLEVDVKNGQGTSIQVPGTSPGDRAKSGERP